jgi:hypothetical protein
LPRSEPGAHKLDHLLDREAMGAHDRFGRTVAGGREQFERTAAVGLGAMAMTVARWGHGAAAAVLGRCL